MIYFVVLAACSLSALAAGVFAATDNPYALAFAVYSGLIAIVTALRYDEP